MKKKIDCHLLYFNFRDALVFDCAEKSPAKEEIPLNRKVRFWWI
jgi:hypothetical protein